MTYDLIIAGSGCVGAATGYYASRAGLNVLMIDARHPPHHEGAHQGYSLLPLPASLLPEATKPLHLRSAELWHQFATVANPPLLHQSGLLMTQPAEDLLTLEDHCLRLSAEQVSERWPQLTLPVTDRLLFDPCGGFVDARQAVSEWVRLAREQGAGQLFNCPVLAIRTEEGEQLVETADGVYRGRKVLISSGSLLNQLWPEIPVTALRHVSAWFQADGRYSSENHFPALRLQMADQGQYIAFPAQDNALSATRENNGQPFPSADTLLPFGSAVQDGSECFRFLRETLSGVGGCLHGISGRYDQTPDGEPIIDLSPGNASCLVIAGTGRQGITLAPALAEIACHFARETTLPETTSPFRLQRFTL